MSNTKQRPDLAQAELELTYHLDIPTQDQELSQEDKALVDEFYRMAERSRKAEQE